MGRCSFAVGLLCGVLSISAVAQTVSEPILIGPPIVSGRVCVETAIVARATPNDEDTGRVVAAWFEINELGRQIFRSAVTLDGWQTPVTAETVTAQGCDGWNPNQYPDPMVGTSPTTGDIWRGSLIFGPGTRSGFWLQRLPNSSNVFESPYSFECWQAVPGSQVVADKPLVGVGPRAGVAGYEERLVLAYTLVERSGECTGGTFASHNHMRGRQSDDALGQSWSTSPRFDIGVSLLHEQARGRDANLRQPHQRMRQRFRWRRLAEDTGRDRIRISVHHARSKSGLNRDGIINAMDVGLFQAGMTCGCGTPAWPP
jgi:hypothetical protein